MRKPLYWIVIFGVVAIILYFVATQVFPQLVGKLAGFIVGLFAVVTGLFLRKKRS